MKPSSRIYYLQYCRFLIFLLTQDDQPIRSLLRNRLASILVAFQPSSMVTACVILTIAAVVLPVSLSHTDREAVLVGGITVSM